MTPDQIYELLDSAIKIGLGALIGGFLTLAGHGPLANLARSK
jgi:hypothetical protein